MKVYRYIFNLINKDTVKYFCITMSLIIIIASSLVISYFQNIDRNSAVMFKLFWGTEES